MRIGIIGLGVIGTANKLGFESVGHTVSVHDLRLNTNISDVIDTDIVYLCVPTPSKNNGDCDTRIVESVILELNDSKYKGVVIIRSTVIPGFTESMIARFENLRIGFVPEFLRERSAVDDFINDHELLAIGSQDLELCDLVVVSHGNLPKSTVQMRPTEAELLKYYNNVYAAMRITFANNMYEVIKKLDCDYSVIKKAYLMTGKSTGKYLDVNEELRGYGGMCLPKDTKAFANLMMKLGIDLKTIQSLVEDNKKYKTTIFPGMRM